MIRVRGMETRSRRRGVLVGCLGLLLALAGLGTAVQSRLEGADGSGPWYAIYADTAVINSDYSLTENGVTYNVERRESYNRPSLYVTGAYSGKSLKMSVPTSVSGDRDRIEYEFVHYSDPLAPQFDGVERYMGFAFRIIGSQSQPPTNGGVILWQGWQGPVTTGWSPPLRIDLKAPSRAGDPWPNRLFIQNDDTGHTTSDTPITLYDATLRVNTWYTYVIGIKPGYDGSGHLDLWVNGVQVVDYDGKIGYTPESAGGETGVLDSLLLKFGIYRHADNPQLAFGYDNIKYADNYTDASP